MLSRRPLQIRPWKLEALDPGSVHASPNTLRIRLDLAEISKKTWKHQFLPTIWHNVLMTAPKLSFYQDEIWCRKQWRNWYQLQKKRFLHNKPSSDENKWHYCHAPLIFSNFGLKFCPHIWTACAHKWEACVFYTLFRDKLWSLLYFFSDRCIGGISRTTKKERKNKKAGFLFVGWCMHGEHPCQKIASKYVILSGDTASPPHWQCVNWPSSYTRYTGVILCAAKCWHS